MRPRSLRRARWREQQTSFHASISPVHPIDTITIRSHTRTLAPTTPVLTNATGRPKAKVTPLLFANRDRKKHSPIFPISSQA